MLQRKSRLGWNWLFHFQYLAESRRCTCRKYFLSFVKWHSLHIQETIICFRCQKQLLFSNGIGHKNRTYRTIKGKLHIFGTRKRVLGQFFADKMWIGLLICAVTCWPCVKWSVIFLKSKADCFFLFLTKINFFHCWLWAIYAKCIHSSVSFSQNCARNLQMANKTRSFTHIRSFTFTHIFINQ